jgi:hypothetical protein
MPLKSCVQSNLFTVLRLALESGLTVVRDLSSCLVALASLIRLHGHLACFVCNLPSQFAPSRPVSCASR